MSASAKRDLSGKIGGLHMIKRRTALALIGSGVSGAALLATKWLPSSVKSIFNGQPASVGHPVAGGATNAISLENALLGTNAWIIPSDKAATTQIQAYLSSRSVAPGNPLTFYVSTQVSGTPYTIDIYRLGWYQGLGGRLVASIKNLQGQAQGYFNEATFELVNSPTTYIDPTTRLVEARWKPSHAITLPDHWTTGVYVAKYTDADGMQTSTTFTVRGNPTAPYVLVTPDATDPAYNNWGGYSLYAGNSKHGTAATKVSMDRPSTVNQGSDSVFIYEINPIRWFERQGYDLSYISNLDLHTNSRLLLEHKAFISLGHDEYWTKEMRDGVEDARNQGRAGLSGRERLLLAGSPRTQHV